MSQVDETLFASNRDSRRSVTLGNAGVVISSSDLQRIRSSVVSRQQVGSSAIERTIQRRTLAKSRRQMMQTIDDQRLKQKAESGEAGVEEAARIRAKLARSIPGHDLTKKVASIEAQAIALHGRRSQIAERRAREAREVARERMFHNTLMRNTAAAEVDADRLVAIQAAKNLADAEALREQVRIREENRLLDLERKENEGLLMKRQFEAAKQEEYRALQNKAKQQRQLTAELVHANQAAAARKAIRIEKDKLIDRAVLKYQRDKARREQAAEEAEIARKIAAEKETARLRALQERATDEKAAEDALRAKRHREQVELKERRAAAAKAEAARRRQEEVNHVVAEQRMHKQRLAVREARRDAAMMKRLAREQAVKVAQDLEADRRVRERNAAYGVEILDQIAEKEARKREVVNEKYEERKRLNLERRIENELLEKMKKDAMQRLATEQGIGVHWSRDIRRVEVENTKVT